MTPLARGRSLLVVLPLALLAACDGGDGLAARAQAAAPPAASAAAPPAAAPPAADAVVARVAVDAPLSLPAQLHVERDVVIAARADGVLESLRVDLGTPVRAGAVLATVESEGQRLALARADAAHADAQRTVARTRLLAAGRVVTAADSESAELAARGAELSLAEARRAVALTSVVAPFDGVVSARYVGPHRLVHAGDTLFRLTETAPLLARVRVPEAQTGGIGVGSAAEVVALDGRATAARVVRIAPAVDAASGTREVVLAVARPGALRPGSAVTVRLGATRRQAVAVPAAVVDDDGYVLVVDGVRTALREVTLGGPLRDGRVEVLAGLAPGERVRRPDR